MSAGWQKGDLALCVKSSPLTIAGQTYRVIRVWQHPFAGLALDFEGMDNGSEFGPGNHWGFNPARFRKIKPDTEAANADDAAWLKDLLAKSPTPSLVTEGAGA